MTTAETAKGFSSSPASACDNSWTMPIQESDAMTHRTTVVTPRWGVRRRGAPSLPAKSLETPSFVLRNSLEFVVLLDIDLPFGSLPLPAAKLLPAPFGLGRVRHFAALSNWRLFEDHSRSAAERP